MEVLGIQFFLALFEKKLDAYKKPPNETKRGLSFGCIYQLV